jgi:hypothetical protein
MKSRAKKNITQLSSGAITGIEFLEVIIREARQQ